MFFKVYLLFLFIIQCFSKPKFLDSHVKRIKDGWDETKDKASARLELLNNTKAAWEGYGLGLENIAVEFEKAEEEIKKAYAPGKRVLYRRVPRLELVV